MVVAEGGIDERLRGAAGAAGAVRRIGGGIVPVEHRASQGGLGPRVRRVTQAGVAWRGVRISMGGRYLLFRTAKRSAELGAWCGFGGALLCLVLVWCHEAERGERRTSREPRSPRPVSASPTPIQGRHHVDHAVDGLDEGGVRQGGLL